MKLGNALKFKTGKAMSGLLHSALNLIQGDEDGDEEKVEERRPAHAPYTAKWPKKLPAIQSIENCDFREKLRKAAERALKLKASRATPPYAAAVNDLLKDPNFLRLHDELEKKAEGITPLKDLPKGARPQIEWAYVYYSQARLLRCVGETKAARSKLEEARSILKTCRRDPDADIELQAALCEQAEMQRMYESGDMTSEWHENGRRAASLAGSCKLDPTSAHELFAGAAAAFARDEKRAGAARTGLMEARSHLGAAICAEKERIKADEALSLAISRQRDILDDAWAHKTTRLRYNEAVSAEASFRRGVSRHESGDPLEDIYEFSAAKKIIQDCSRAPALTGAKRETALCEAMLPFLKRCKDDPNPERFKRDENILSTWCAKCGLERAEKNMEALASNLKLMHATKSMQDIMRKKALSAKKKLMDRRKALAKEEQRKLQESLETPATIKVLRVCLLEMEKLKRKARTFAAIRVVPVEYSAGEGAWATTKRGKGSFAEYPFPKKASCLDLEYSKPAGGGTPAKAPALMIEIRKRRAIGTDPVLCAAEVPLQQYLLIEKRKGKKISEVTFILKDATGRSVGRCVADIRVENLPRTQ